MLLVVLSLTLRLFVFYEVLGSVAQAGPKLLGLKDSPASAAYVAGTASVSYLAS